MRFPGGNGIIPDLMPVFKGKAVWRFSTRVDETGFLLDLLYVNGMLPMLRNWEEWSLTLPGVVFEVMEMDAVFPVL